MLRRWDLPGPPWVLHSRSLLGKLTEPWIDTQARATSRYGSRLLGLTAVDGSTPAPHWLLARERLDLRLAYSQRARLGGVSSLWLLSQLRASPPDVVHAHFGPGGTEVLTLARALRVPLATSFYGVDATAERFTEGRAWKRRYGRLFRHGRGFIAEGPAMASRVEALGCDPDRIHVVRLPANAEALEGVPVEKADQFVAAVAGRFIPKKGFDLGIRAFARALGGLADARLLMVGGGELEGSYRRLVEELGIGAQVTWAGRLPFQEFMRRLATAHVSLYPSRTAPDGDSEGGAPVVLIEAQWLGVPGLISEHDDLPFVSAPDGSVRLGSYAVDDWADALRGLYEDRSRALELGREASRFAREHHSPAANAVARESVYDRMTDG
jgi:colanic acid/amylovoran biosynthesis glycosyltransferase